MILFSVSRYITSADSMGYQRSYRMRHTGRRFDRVKLTLVDKSSTKPCRQQFESQWTHHILFVSSVQLLSYWVSYGHWYLYFLCFHCKRIVNLCKGEHGFHKLCICSWNVWHDSGCSPYKCFDKTTISKGHNI